MFKNILVPLDGSELSEEALPLAQRLLEGTDAEATLFRVSDPPRATVLRKRGLRRTLPLASMPGAFPRGVIPGEPPRYVETKDQAIDRLERELLEYLHEAGQSLVETGCSIHAAVHLGEPTEEIIDYAKQAKIDLIVMVTHGRSGLRETLQGSVTTEVIRSGVAPVLVILPKGERSADKGSASLGAKSELRDEL